MVGDDHHERLVPDAGVHQPVDEPAEEEIRRSDLEDVALVRLAHQRGDVVTQRPSKTPSAASERAPYCWPVELRIHGKCGTVAWAA